jgi:hypothetical protein
MRSGEFFENCTQTEKMFSDVLVLRPGQDANKFND